MPGLTHGRGPPDNAGAMDHSPLRANWADLDCHPTYARTGMVAQGPVSMAWRAEVKLSPACGPGVVDAAHDGVRTKPGPDAAPCGILLSMGGYFNSASDGLLLLLRRYTNQQTTLGQVDPLESHPDLTSLFATPWTLFAGQVPLLIPRWRDRDSHGPPRKCG